MARKQRIRDGVFTCLILLTVFCVNLLLQNLFHTQAMTPMLFVLGVFLVSWRTQGYLYGIEVFSLYILDESHLHDILVIDGAYIGWYRCEACEL